jgi:hypothetical protein
MRQLRPWVDITLMTLCGAGAGVGAVCSATEKTAMPGSCLPKPAGETFVSGAGDADAAVAVDAAFDAQALKAIASRGLSRRIFINECVDAARNSNASAHLTTETGFAAPHPHNLNPSAQPHPRRSAAGP